ncbi:MAG: FAD-binding oxidoreductase [Synechococcaceae cyanobacterium RM1_1_27]|nr:FAD-binding oxidoreductase [Synechococcaceae cyanobacterium RM1_1_27]
MAALDPHWQSALAEASLTPVQGLVSPDSAADLADLVSQASAQQQRLLIAGAGSKLCWGSPVQSPSWAVSTQKLNRLVAHAVSDLTVTVEAGIPLKTLQAHLADSQQWWPVDPLYPESATVGGIIATADAGSLRHRYGSVRDLVLGISFIRADGQLAKAGGRVVKNVAGYDLMKLMSGSFGTLGILSEMTLRLYPLPAQRCLWLISGAADDVAQLSAAMMDSPLTPTGLDVLSAGFLQEFGIPDPLGLLIQVQGAEVEPQLEGIRALLHQLKLAHTLTNLGSGDVEVLRGKSADGLLLKLRSLPNRSVFWADWLSRTYPGSRIQIHRGSGIGRWWAPTLTPSTLSQVRARLQQEGGSLTLLEAPLWLRQQWDPWGIPVEIQGLMASIRQQFDPRAILNPGKLI